MKLLPLLSVPLLLSCGPSTGLNGVGPSSGLPRTAAIGSLSPSDAGILCDWTNAKQGGYGRAVSCADGTQQGTDPDKTSCVQSVGDYGGSCPTLTVADVEDCADATGTNVCAFGTTAACDKLAACFTSLGM